MDAISYVLDQFTGFTGKGILDSIVAESSDSYNNSQTKKETEIDILHGIHKTNNFQDFKSTEASVPSNMSGKAARVNHKIELIRSWHLMCSGQ